MGVKLNHDKIAEDKGIVKEPKPSQLVKLVTGELAILLYECKEPKDHWGVLIKDEKKEEITIKTISKKHIISYKNFCWKCGYKPLETKNHETCSTCHWLICPECGACRKPECTTDGININL